MMFYPLRVPDRFLFGNAEFKKKCQHSFVAATTGSGETGARRGETDGIITFPFQQTLLFKAGNYAGNRNMRYTHESSEISDAAFTLAVHYVGHRFNVVLSGFTGVIPANLVKRGGW